MSKPIHWFPGHMQKALRMMAEEISLVDCVLMVLDARVPRACINPYFEELIGTKPVVYLLSKADLANPALSAKWVAALARENTRAVALNAAAGRSGAVKDILSAVTDLKSAKAKIWETKGLNYTPKAMVIGVPNTGKSTVINTLCGSGRAITGDRPGVTRGKQWVRVGDVIDLLDTPGTLPQKFDDQAAARHLAFVGSIKDELLDISELAFHLVEELNAIDKAILTARYDILPSEETLVLFQRIARARGCLVKGGEYDYERCAAAILDDFRKGRLGRITLEKP